MTKATLRDRVLRKLGILEGHQSPDAEDAAIVEDAYDELYQMLVNDGLAVWGTDIPLNVAWPLRDLLCASLADTFMLAEGKVQRLVALGPAAEAKLRSQLASEYTPETTPFDTF